MAGFSEWLFGSQDKLTKLPTGTKQQQGLHGNLISKAMGLPQGEEGYGLANQYYNNLLGENQGQAFDQFSQPYMQQFQEQILPQIAERFAGMGALSSSGFGQALGGAASGLQGQLAQLFSQLQQQAAGQQYDQYNNLGQQYGNLAQTGLGYQPFAYNKQEGSAGFLGPLLGAIGSKAANPIGKGLGSGIMNLFKPKATTGGIT
jgi:hypothetical protein